MSAETGSKTADEGPRGRAGLGPPIQPSSEPRPPRPLGSEVEYHAAHLDETSGAAYLFCSTSQVFRTVGLDAYKLYLTRLIAQAGDPADPIERMLIEQIALAHHNVGRLHVKATTAETLEETRVYLGSAALLTGEFRRTVATLKDYRQTTGAPALRVEIAPAAPAPTEPGARSGDEEMAPTTEQGSNPTAGAADHDATIVPFATQPEPGAGRPVEPPEASRADRRRGRKAARRGAG